MGPSLPIHAETKVRSPPNSCSGRACSNGVVSVLRFALSLAASQCSLAWAAAHACAAPSSAGGLSCCFGVASNFFTDSSAAFARWNEITYTFGGCPGWLSAPLGVAAAEDGPAPPKSSPHSCTPFRSGPERLLPLEASCAAAFEVPSTSS